MIKSRGLFDNTVHYSHCNNSSLESLQKDAEQMKKVAEKEINAVKEEKALLTRKYYHHAFLAVKLKLVDKNFSLPELVDMAMKEQVDEKELNNWITKKLGLKSLD